jgi:hypothetical protein
MDELARQNTFYLEAMVTPLGAQSRAAGARPAGRARSTPPSRR